MNRTNPPEGREGMARVLRFVFLRFSLSRGYRRQRIAREVRSADVKRGLTRKGAVR